MAISKVKYQIVVSHDLGTKMIMSTHSTLEDAQSSYQIAKTSMESGIGNILMLDPDWNQLELQRVEVLEG